MIMMRVVAAAAVVFAIATITITISAIAQFTTTTTPTAATTTADEPKVVIDRPTTAARLAAEDPYFARFEQVFDSCMDLPFGNATTTPAQCQSSLQQGADR